MKTAKKIYLESPDWKNLIEKARKSGFEGKGMLSHYIQKIAKEPVVFLDENTKTLLKSLNLKAEE